MKGDLTCKEKIGNDCERKMFKFMLKVISFFILS